MGPTHWPNVIRLFSLLFFFFFPWLSSFFASPLCFSLSLRFVFPVVILLNPSTNLVTEIKVWTCSADLHHHLALPTLWALSPSAARSRLSCRSGADLWSWTWLMTRYSPSFSLPCQVGHGWQQYSSFHCCAVPRSPFFFLVFSLVWSEIGVSDFDVWIFVLLLLIFEKPLISLQD